MNRATYKQNLNKNDLPSPPLFPIWPRHAGAFRPPTIPLVFARRTKSACWVDDYDGGSENECNHHGVPLLLRPHYKIWPARPSYWARHSIGLFTIFAMEAMKIHLRPFGTSANLTCQLVEVKQKLKGNSYWWVRNPCNAQLPHENGCIAHSFAQCHCDADLDEWSSGAPLSSTWNGYRSLYK